MIFCFTLKSSAEIEDVWNALEESGVQVLYSDDDGDGLMKIYGTGISSLEMEALKHQLPILEIKQQNELPEINWQEQWEIHGHNYRDGYVNIDLHEFGFKGECNPLRLTPGPGFGDLSHPTTKIVLLLMAQHLNKNRVLDIGCGSGILSIAAVAMGAPAAVGLDIDKRALEHAHENAILNKMSKCIEFHTHETLNQINPPAFALMNMISSEQISAWDSLQPLQSTIKTVITSGIHKEEKHSYLTLVKSWGFSCIEQIELEEWLGFLLIRGEN